MSICWVFLAFTHSFQAVWAQDDTHALSMQKALELRGAFFYHFGTYINWPGPKGNLPSRRFCVLENQPRMYPYLKKYLLNRKSQERPIDLKLIRENDEIKHCHLLYVDSSYADQWENIFPFVEGNQVVTVDEREDFLSRNGMIRFYEKKNHELRFIIHLPLSRKRECASVHNFCGWLESILKGRVSPT